MAAGIRRKNRQQNSRVFRTQGRKDSRMCRCEMFPVHPFGSCFAERYSRYLRNRLPKKRMVRPTPAYTPVHFAAMPSPMQTPQAPRGSRVRERGTS